MSINILVTAAGGAIGQGIIKGLKLSSLDFTLTTTDTHPYAAGLYRGRHGYLVPPATDPNFIHTMTELVYEHSIDCIIPGTDYELNAFAQAKNDIHEKTGAVVLVSNAQTIRIAEDKWHTYTFLQDNGFPAVPSALPEDKDMLVDEEGFPLIVKPRIGDSSKNTFVVRTRAELDEALDILLNAPENVYLGGKSEPVIQKYVGTDKDEFTSTTLVFENRCYGVVSMQREMRFGGHTTKAEIREYPAVDDIVRRAAERLNPFGPCNFQSRLHAGRVYIFEINCRYSGTSATCSLAGFNHVEAAVRKAVLQEDIADLTFQPGLMLRYFNELFVPLDTVEQMERDRGVENPESRVHTGF